MAHCRAESHPTIKEKVRSKITRGLGRLCLLATEVQESQTVPAALRPMLPQRKKRVEAVKSILATTGTYKPLLSMLTSEHQGVIGSGAGSLVVLETEGRVAKYHYNTSGLSLAELSKQRDMLQAEFNTVKNHFGEIIQPTTYDISRSPMRGFRAKHTLVARQDYLYPKIDLLSPAGQRMVAEPAQERARQDIAQLVDASTTWAQSDKWLDLIGKENLLLTPVDGTWRLRLIDPLPLTESELEMVHPNVGVTNRERLQNRLSELSIMAEMDYPAMARVA